MGCGERAAGAVGEDPLPVVKKLLTTHRASLLDVRHPAAMYLQDSCLERTDKVHAERTRTQPKRSRAMPIRKLKRRHVYFVRGRDQKNRSHARRLACAA